MKKKTIAKVLRSKFKEFLDSIWDDEVRKLAQQNSMITGGSIASLLNGEPVNDYDVYFTDQKTCKAVAEYFMRVWNQKNALDHVEVCVGPGIDGGGGPYKPKYDKDRVWIFIPSSGMAGEPQPGVAGEQLGDTVEEFELQPDDPEDKPKYEPIFLSQNAITLTGRIQLIVRFYGTPEEIHKNYDFAHCTNYWLSKDATVHLNSAALEALITRELVYIGSKYPVCSIIRTRKFIRKGYGITAGSYLKMILQCNELDLFDLDVLEDQLVGVDSAYFMQVINAVRAHPEKLTSAYLIEVIDRIF